VKMEKKDYICGDKNHYVRYSHSPLELPNGEIVLFKIEEIFRSEGINDDVMKSLFKDVEQKINWEILEETKLGNLYQYYPHFYFDIANSNKNLDMMASMFHMERVEALNIMLYPGKILNMQVIYTIDPDYSANVLKDMLDKAITAGIGDVVVYIPTFGSESYVMGVQGLTMAGNHEFKYSTLSGVIVTKQTIMSTKKPLHFVIAVGIEDAYLRVLEDRKDVWIVIVINEDIANVDGWLKLYDAKDANTGVTRMQGMTVEPLLNRAIGRLKQIADGSTPLYDFKRDDYLRETANLLKRNNVTYTADIVAAQCIKRGLDARSARVVAGVFGKALQTHGDMPIKVGRPNYDVMLEIVNDEKYEEN